MVHKQFPILYEHGVHVFDNVDAGDQPVVDECFTDHYSFVFTTGGYVNQVNFRHFTSIKFLYKIRYQTITQFNKNGYKNF